MERDLIDAAARFVRLNGSVLDQRRLELLLGTGDAESVVTALAAHRTGDGGYAYALEPDVKGPAPQPLSAMTALEILDEAEAIDQDAGAGVCEWLEGVTTDDGGVPVMLASIADQPRPPWVEPPAEPEGELLTTARIAGLLRGRVNHGWIDRAAAFCRERIDALESTHPYEVFSVNAFLETEPDRAWAERASTRIGAIVRETGLVLLDPANPQGLSSPPGYAEDEFHGACDFAPGPDRLAARWFTDAELQRSLDRLGAEQQDDGGWPIHYRRWTPSIEQQARPPFTLAALRILWAWSR